VDASPQKFHKMNCKVSQQRSGLVSGRVTTQQSSSSVSVGRDVYLVLEILGQKLFSAGVTAEAAFHKLSSGVRYIGVPLHVCQFA